MFRLTTDTSRNNKNWHRRKYRLAVLILFSLILFDVSARPMQRVKSKHPSLRGSPSPSPSKSSPSPSPSKSPSSAPSPSSSSSPSPSYTYSPSPSSSKPTTNVRPATQHPSVASPSSRLPASRLNVAPPPALWISSPSILYQGVSSSRPWFLGAAVAAATLCSAGRYSYAQTCRLSSYCSVQI